MSEWETPAIGDLDQNILRADVAAGDGGRPQGIGG